MGTYVLYGTRISDFWGGVIIAHNLIVWTLHGCIQINNSIGGKFKFLRYSGVIHISRIFYRHLQSTSQLVQDIKLFSDGYVIAKSYSKIN